VPPGPSNVYPARSRRRLVYAVDDDAKLVPVVRTWHRADVYRPL